MEPWRGRRRSQWRSWGSKWSRGGSIDMCADLAHVDEELNLETDPHHRKKVVSGSASQVKSRIRIRNNVMRSSVSNMMHKIFC
jgi:hypothetical protein